MSCQSGKATRRLAIEPPFNQPLVGIQVLWPLAEIGDNPNWGYDPKREENAN
jgi:hypothetical protein